MKSVVQDVFFLKEEIFFLVIFRLNPELNLGKMGFKLAAKKCLCV